MKVKVSKTKNKQLNWMVAKALGFVKISVWDDGIFVCKKHSFEDSLLWQPTVDPSQGYPIIEEELLSPTPLLDANCALIRWECYDWKGKGEEFYGATALIAAMRTFVSSRLGDEVEIPEGV